MSGDLELLLRDLVSDPVRLRVLPPEQEQTVVASLRAALGGESPSLPAATPAVVPPACSEADLLTVLEAAVMLRVSRRWLYRHAKQLPFARKLSPKVLRFSRAGALKWLEKQRP
jgi:predicted DNA-binding transcriptional regulator AlpA